MYIHRHGASQVSTKRGIWQFFGGIGSSDFCLQKAGWLVDEIAAGKETACFRMKRCSIKSDGSNMLVTPDSGASYPGYAKRNLTIHGQGQLLKLSIHHFLSLTTRFSLL